MEYLRLRDLLTEDKNIKIYVQKGKKPPKGKTLKKGPRGGQYFVGTPGEKDQYEKGSTGSASVGSKVKYKGKDGVITQVDNTGNAVIRVGNKEYGPTSKYDVASPKKPTVNIFDKKPKQPTSVNNIKIPKGFNPDETNEVAELVADNFAKLVDRKTLPRRWEDDGLDSKNAKRIEKFLKQIFKPGPDSEYEKDDFERYVENFWDDFSTLDTQAVGGGMTRVSGGQAVGSSPSTIVKTQDRDWFPKDKAADKKHRMQRALRDEHQPEIDLPDLVDASLGHDQKITPSRAKKAAEDYWRNEGGYDEWESNIQNDDKLSETDREYMLEPGSPFSIAAEKKFVKKIMDSARTH